MDLDRLRSSSALTVVTVLGWPAVAPLAVQAQTPGTTTAARKGTWVAPRKADSQPDLHGVWSFANLTSLERPRVFAGKEFLTPAEAAEFKRRVIESSNNDRRDQQPVATTDVGRAITTSGGIGEAKSPEIFARRWSSIRMTEGRVPGTGGPGGEGVEDGTLGGVDGRGGCADRTTDRSLTERCILGFNPFHRWFRVRTTTMFSCSRRPTTW